MWDRAEELMTRLEVPKTRVAHVMGAKDPAVAGEGGGGHRKGPRRLTRPRAEA